MAHPDRDIQTSALDASTTPGRYLREHPASAALLVLAVLGGAISGFYGFAEVLSPLRSVLGGAVAGFGCWLLVMVGRVIGD